MTHESDNAGQPEAGNNGQPNPLLLPAPAGKSQSPSPPPKLKRYRTTNLRAIRRELSSIYAEARNKLMPLPDACRYAFILSILCRVLESSEIETRLARLEAQDAAMMTFEARHDH